MTEGSVVAEARRQGPGAALRGLREARGFSIDDLAHALKLTPRQIRAIEAEDFASLNGKTFARGFVRNYARVVGVDPTPLLADLDQQLAAGEVRLLPPSNARGDMPISGAPRSLSRSLAVVIVVILVVSIMLFAYDRTTSSGVAQAPATRAPTPPELPLRASPQVGAAPESARPTAAAATPPSDTPAAAAVAPAASGADAIASVPAPAAAQEKLLPASPQSASSVSPPVPAQAAEPQRVLRFQFERESWVEVKDGGGNVILSRNNPAGSSQTVEGKPPFSLVIGNAAHVSLSYGDTAIDLKPHTTVSVARLSLN